MLSIRTRFPFKPYFVCALILVLVVAVVRAEVKDEKKASYIAASLQRVFPRTLFEPVRFLVVPVFISDSCFDSLLVNYELTDTSCLKETISKVAGYGIVILSSILKVPVIVNIIQSGCVTGLSISSIYIETSMYMTIFAYNYFIESPISTYGETLVIMFQNFILCVLLWKYMNKGYGYRFLTVLMFTIFGGLVYFTPESYYWVLVTWSIICSCVSKLPQIYTNFMLGHTGVLSIITTLMQVLGGSVRFLTILYEVTDKLAIACNGIALFLNIMILLQIVLFRKKTKQVMIENQARNSQAKKTN
mmetsp:Transcript_16051/g.18771  ORF Transcript_16051/g.18771 Transcript_16051/m.18771 type:complete len:303 (-) Transcript_16051:697-1605(-)